MKRTKKAPHPTDNPEIRVADAELRRIRKKQLTKHNQIQKLYKDVELLRWEEHKVIERLNQLDDEWYEKQKRKSA